MHLPRERVLAVLFAASALLACRLLLALVVIPPWQQPDEPSHISLIELQRTRIDLLDGRPDPAREADILQSMARYDWWEHRDRGFPIPGTVPDRFLAAGLRVAVDVTSVTKPTPYFLLVGRLFSWLPRLPVVDELYIVRALSAAFGMLTLWVAWLGAREILGAARGATVAILLALHPQFAIVSTSAAPDALINLLGACMWWQTAVALRRDALLSLVGVWMAAVAAAASDRMGLPLLAVAFIVSVVVVTVRLPLRGRIALLAVPAIVVVGAAILAGATWAVDQSQNTFSWRHTLFGAWMPVPHAMTWDFFTHFTALLHQSWWFSLGWGRYPPPSWWASIAIGLTALAGVGVARRIFTASELDARTRLLMALAVIAFAVQLSAVYWAYFRPGYGVQGKSLFPVLVPCLVLLWAGLEAWVPPSRRLHAAAALALLFALLDITAWTLVAIPAYYASL